mgnify:CR=1 FL=1
MCIRDRLYHELQTAQMDFTDLELLGEAEKREDLLAIFEAVSEMLVQHQYESQSKMAVFLNQVEAGHLEEQLKDVAIVVDGFTRFSAEEEALIGLLHRKGVEIVIGVYASEKAYRASFREGNLYQASVDFLSFSWQRLLRYSHSIVGKRSKTLLVALPAC